MGDPETTSAESKPADPKSRKSSASLKTGLSRWEKISSSKFFRLIGTSIIAGSIFLGIGYVPLKKELNEATKTYQNATEEVTGSVNFWRDQNSGFRNLAEQEFDGSTNIYSEILRREKNDVITAEQGVEAFISDRKSEQLLVAFLREAEKQMDSMLATFSEGKDIHEMRVLKRRNIDLFDIYDNYTETLITLRAALINYQLDLTNQWNELTSGVNSNTYETARFISPSDKIVSERLLFGAISIRLANYKSLVESQAAAYGQHKKLSDEIQNLLTDYNLDFCQTSAPDDAFDLDASQFPKAISENDVPAYKIQRAKCYYHYLYAKYYFAKKDCRDAESQVIAAETNDPCKSRKDWADGIYCPVEYLHCQIAESHIYNEFNGEKLESLQPHVSDIRGFLNTYMTHYNTYDEEKLNRDYLYFLMGQIEWSVFIDPTNLDNWTEISSYLKDYNEHVDIGKAAAEDLQVESQIGIIHSNVIYTICHGYSNEVKCPADADKVVSDYTKVEIDGVNQLHKIYSLVNSTNSTASIADITSQIQKVGDIVSDYKKTGEEGLPWGMLMRIKADMNSLSNCGTNLIKIRSEFGNWQTNRSN